MLNVLTFSPYIPTMSVLVTSKASKIHLIETVFANIVSWLEDRQDFESIYGILGATKINSPPKTKTVGLTILVLDRPCAGGQQPKLWMTPPSPQGHER